MSQSEAWTIGRLLTWTTDYFKQQGSDSPRLDAEVLLAASRGCQRIELYTAFDQLADNATRTKFRDLVRRRAEGEPVAYLVGKREFFSLTFQISGDVLIPRPETELLVVRLLDLVRQQLIAAPNPSIADVGTGSGIIAICAAKHLPQAKVIAIDASPGALAIARRNAADHGVADRIEFVESDLFESVPPAHKFDVVASNPPYVGQAEFATLAPSVRNFEPQAALVAGPSGTEVIERIIPQVAERLNPAGWLLLEVSPMIEPAVCELIAARSNFALAPTIQDHAGHARVVQARNAVGQQ